MSTKKGKAKPRTPDEQLHMRRRISAMMGRLQRIKDWTPRQREEWDKLFRINEGISWCLGAEYVFPPFVLPEEEADCDG